MVIRQAVGRIVEAQSPIRYLERSSGRQRCVGRVLRQAAVKALPDVGPTITAQATARVSTPGVMAPGISGKSSGYHARQLAGVRIQWAESLRRMGKE